MPPQAPLAPTAPQIGDDVTHLMDGSGAATPPAVGEDVTHLMSSGPSIGDRAASWGARLGHAVGPNPMPFDRTTRTGLSPTNEQMLGGGLGAAALGAATEGMGLIPEATAGVGALVRGGLGLARSLPSVLGAFGGGAGVSAAQGGSPSDALQAGGVQAGLEAGGKLIAAPATWLLKRTAASSIYKAASEKLGGMRQSVGNAFSSALTRAEQMVGETTAAKADVGAATAARSATIKATGQAQVEAAKTASQTHVEGAQAGLRTTVAQGQQEADAARQKFAATPPPPTTGAQVGRQAAQVLTRIPPPPGVAPSPVKQSFDAIGKRVRNALAQTPDQDIRGIKAEAQDILKRETTLPTGPTLDSSSLSGSDATTPVSSPSRTALTRIANMPDVVSASELHHANDTLNGVVGSKWDNGLSNTGVGRAKHMYGVIRTQLGGASPAFDQAAHEYHAASQLYKNSLSPTIVQLAKKNPDAVAGLFKPNEPERLRMVQQVFFQHGGTDGQAAWDGLRSHIVYDQFIQGGLDKLGTRLASADPEFLQILGHDPAGASVISNLHQIADGFESLQARAAAAKGVAQVQVRLERSAGAKGIRTARTGAAQANTTAQHAQQAATAGTAETLAARKGVVTGLKDSAGAADTHLATQEQALKESSLHGVPGAAQTMKDLALLGGTATAGHMIGGPVGAVAGPVLWATRYGVVPRLLKSPQMADLVQWASYSPKSTQMLVQALKSPAPGMMLTDLMRLMSTTLGELDKRTVGPPPGPAR